MHFFFFFRFSFFFVSFKFLTLQTHRLGISPYLSLSRTQSVCPTTTFYLVRHLNLLPPPCYILPYRRRVIYSLPLSIRPHADTQSCKTPSPPYLTFTLDSPFLPIFTPFICVCSYFLSLCLVLLLSRCHPPCCC